MLTYKTASHFPYKNLWHIGYLYFRELPWLIPVWSSRIYPYKLGLNPLFYGWSLSPLVPKDWLVHRKWCNVLPTLQSLNGTLFNSWAAIKLREKNAWIDRIAVDSGSGHDSLSRDERCDATILINTSDIRWPKFDTLWSFPIYSQLLRSGECLPNPCWQRT